jgi:hypothetical protein
MVVKVNEPDRLRYFPGTVSSRCPHTPHVISKIDVFNFNN